MKCFLLGYMASGKSTIGKALAKQLNLNFYDLDSYIEVEEKQPISEIFQTKGEIYFRILEHKKLKELIAKEEDMVVALGGGTPCYAGNMNYILNHGTSIYLQYSLQILVDRLWKENMQRPMIAHLKTKELLEDFVRKHIFERANYYLQADLKLNLTNETEEEVVQKIKILLQ